MGFRNVRHWSAERILMSRFCWCFQNGLIAPTFCWFARYTCVLTMASAATLGGEELLIRRAQRGDRSAFAVLVEHYWDRLYRWLHHLTHDRHSAEDVAQEAFLKAFAKLNSFRPGTSFQAWLFRIAHNHLSNQRRAARRARYPFPEHVPTADVGPDVDAMSREAMQLLARAVG